MDNTTPVWHFWTQNSIDFFRIYNIFHQICNLSIKLRCTLIQDPKLRSYGNGLPIWRDPKEYIPFNLFLSLVKQVLDRVLNCDTAIPMLATSPNGGWYGTNFQIISRITTANMDLKAARSVVGLWQCRERVGGEMEGGVSEGGREEGKSNSLRGSLEGRLQVINKSNSFFVYFIMLPSTYTISSQKTLDSWLAFSCSSIFPIKVPN